ncbi:hypothetical protein BBW65_05200 [Helicobacter enhydrae]|uniref:Lipid A biosynthesis lauroyl acyltransferase n=2 Tax=Helicobacter enhydrae TaxID=222136 RepID=A0A1B1U7Q5_9HELI|nr:hypothetical protein BBW65_05200 [Helicobacter enhydrae]
MPHRCFLFCVDSLAFVFRKFDKRRYQDALINLNFVYADQMNDEEKHQIILRNYRNFAFVLLESLRAMYIDKQEHYQKFDFENLDYYLDIEREGKSAVIVSGHFGYWEAIGSALPRFTPNHELYSLGRLTQFEAVNQVIIQSRQSYGVKLIDKKGALKDLLKLYAKPRQIAGIIVDQNVFPNEGVWVEFFGKEVTHTPVASVLSRRFKIPIVPVFIDFNEDYTRFKVKFFEPFYCPVSENVQEDILEATQRQAQIMQEMVEANPKSWFWFHKRFKARYSEIYH